MLSVFGMKTAAGQPDARSRRPNIVIIFMDDMGYGDPDFVAGIAYTTPNMDRLAAESLRRSVRLVKQTSENPARTE